MLDAVRGTQDHPLPSTCSLYHRGSAGLKRQSLELESTAK